LHQLTLVLYSGLFSSDVLFCCCCTAGQLMLGQPVMVKPAEAEKNMAWEAQQAAKQSNAAEAELAALGLGPLGAGAAPPPGQCRCINKSHVFLARGGSQRGGLISNHQWCRCIMVECVCRGVCSAGCVQQSSCVCKGVGDAALAVRSCMCCTCARICMVCSCIAHACVLGLSRAT
jgi:hypothetical protein